MNPLSKPFFTISVVATILCLLLIGCASNKTNGPAPTPIPTPTVSIQSTPTQKPSISPSQPPSSNPSSSPKSTPIPSPTVSPIINGNVTSDQAKMLIADRSAEVIAAIKDKDMKKLATFVHPEKGVRFSPYTHVDMKSNLVFQATPFPDLMTDTTLHNWGNYDGSGDPIKLTFANYYDKFIYNHDFAKPEQLRYNDPIGTGNMINNTRTVYPLAIIVEYHFSGFDKKFEGMDWASLKLVFENKNKDWFLIGIVHDQWTI